MLPEHVEELQEIWKEDYYEPKQITGDLNEVLEQINQAYQIEQDVNLCFYNGFRYEHLHGKVISIDATNQHFQFKYHQRSYKQISFTAVKRIDF